MKPALLYHASPVRGVKKFEPRAESVRDSNEGPVVFASSDKAYASMFIVPTDDSWTKRGRFSKDEPWFMVISDRQGFVYADQGGSIYQFDPGDFNFDSQRSMGSIEWTSSHTVNPVNEEPCHSGYEAMKDLGVKVYFVDAETFRSIQTSNDYGRSIITSLTPNL